MPRRLTGLIAAVHTPLHPDGSLRLEMIERQAELLTRHGASGVFVGGTTGECHSLTVEERMQLATRWVDAASGTPLCVVVQVGHNCLPDAVQLAGQAAELGADAISAMPPCYFRPASLDDLLDFCAPVAAAAPGLPFYYYDIPGMTGVQFPTVEILRAGAERIPTLAGVKFSNPDIRQMQACVELDEGRFDVLFGSDEALLAGLSLGARGAVGSTYNFATPLYRRLIEAFEQGDLVEARRLQATSVRLVETLVRHGFMGAAKWTMSLLGVDCGPVRSPLRNLSPAQQQMLHRELSELNVLEQPPAGASSPAAFADQAAE
ncbi:MAG: dihydrodipicolinate synthase family protein [Pirellulaceae bacterium]|nr:dihydrodipicolinate synthase family protein [Pirellulaceae bacterium]